MSTKSRKRLLKDLKMLQKEPQDGIMAHPSQDSLMIWAAVIFGWVPVHCLSYLHLN
eukprot:m.17132 g.17132  ORF g.17132 m.17132 type:complete len:56 (+) comp10652_c0_seq2:111-278(+)